MPYNPAGLFSLIASYFATPGATIRTEQHNPVFEDVAAALSNVLVRDGRAPMTGPLNMNGFPINNAVAGTSPSSVATLAQSMPIGAVIDFAGSTAPSGWALCYGQAVSRATYATLFALIGTTFGAGDGSTTFNLPDLRGRVAAGKDDMGGVTANRLTAAMPSNTLGGTGGVANYVLTQGNLPAVSYNLNGTPGTVTVNSTRNDVFVTPSGIFAGLIQNVGNFWMGNNPSFSVQITSTGTFTPAGTIGPLGSAGAFNIVQPTLILNKIIRVSYDV